MLTRYVTTGLFAASLLTLSGLAQAAPVADRMAADAGSADRPVRTVAVTEGEDDTSNCSRARRRLWVEGEGWIVRRITTCR